MAGDGDTEVSRPPDLEDLKRLCAALNAAGARYMVIGGMAVNYYGLSRATEDVDLLVDASPENVRRLKMGLSVLADNAARDVAETDLAEHVVVRVVDEVTVDLIARIGEVTFENAEAVQVVVDGVVIPVASLPTLIATKGGLREKDRLDLQFLLKVRKLQE